LLEVVVFEVIGHLDRRRRFQIAGTRKKNAAHRAMVICPLTIARATLMTIRALIRAVVLGGFHIRRVGVIRDAGNPIGAAYGFSVMGCP
jgi:hypothetical protein